MRTKPQYNDLLGKLWMHRTWFNRKHYLYDKAGLDVYYIDFILGTEKKI